MTVQHNIIFPDGKQYRPDLIIVDGIEYSMTKYAQKYGYNWQTSAGGNILYYMSKNGDTLTFKQDYLLNYKRYNPGK